MLRKQICLMTILMAFFGLCFSSWAGSSEKTYGGSLDDAGHAIEKTTDGGYIIGGSTESFESGKRGGYLIKIDASGNKSWEKYFGGQGNDYT